MVSNYRSSPKTGKRFVNITIADKLKSQFYNKGRLKFHAENLCSKSTTNANFCEYSFHDGSKIEIERDVIALAPVKFDANAFNEKERLIKEGRKKLTVQLV